MSFTSSVKWYHSCRMDAVSGRRRCCLIVIIIIVIGEWLKTPHTRTRYRLHQLDSFRFNFPESQRTLWCIYCTRDRVYGVSYSRFSVRDSHLHVHSTYSNFQLVRWRKTCFAPNRIEFERRRRNNTSNKNHAIASCVCFSFSILIVFLSFFRVSLCVYFFCWVPVFSLQILIWSKRTVCVCVFKWAGDAIKTRFQ